MSYSNYAGHYLEGLIMAAIKTMDSIKKYKSFNLSLLQLNEIKSMTDNIDEAILLIKNLDFNRYRNAKKHSNLSNIKDKVDKFLAIDDFLYNDEENLTIGLDWTININDINYKVEKHLELQEALSLLVDKTCVVCIVNEDILGDLEASKLAKSIYSLLKIVNKSVICSKDFASYIIIDANDLI